LATKWLTLSFLRSSVVTRMNTVGRVARSSILSVNPRARTTSGWDSSMHSKLAENMRTGVGGAALRAFSLVFRSVRLS
jgi:hypothetical protein